MRNKLIYLVLSASAFCAPCNAQEELPKEPQEYYERPMTRAPGEGVDDEEEMSMPIPRAFSFPYQLSNELQTALTRTVKSVDVNGYEVTFDDNCIIEVKYWWRSTAKNWSYGDQIVLSFYKSNILYPRIAIHNLTRQETAWGNYFVKNPNIAPNTIVIKEVLPKGLIAINRDVMLKIGNDSLHFIYKYWEAGDPLEILLDPYSLDGSNVRVWNTCFNSILLDVRVLSFEEAEKILN